MPPSHHPVFPQPHRPIRPKIGPVNRNTQTFGLRNRFAPGLWPVVLARPHDPVIEACTPQRGVGHFAFANGKQILPASLPLADKGSRCPKY